MAKEVKSSAPALSRGLRVMEILARANSAETLTSISKEMGIAMSSAHSICTTLVNEGYIEKHSDGTFHLTLRVLDLASSTINRYEIVEHFNSACDDIEIIRANGATLTVLDGADVYFIAVRNSPHPLGVTFRTGTRLPACCMASGRALLSNLSDEDVCKLYPDAEIPQMTKANPKYRTELLEILEEARRSGYSTEIKGTRPHMCSYGALVAAPGRRAVAGVALSLYGEDMTKAIEKEAIAAIQLLAARLSKYADLVG